MRYTPIFLLLIGCGQSQLEKVVGVSDGDTITVLDAEKKTHKIRLQHIDTPERKQSFGTKAKQMLSDKVFGKEVRIERHSKDRYGRTIGVVYLGSRCINLEMVQEGWAWHYKQFSKSSEYAEAEKAAKKKKLGLWQDTNPIPPWEFRKKK